MDRMFGYLSRVKENETKLQMLKRKVEERRTQKELITKRLMTEVNDSNRLVIPKNKEK